MAKPRRKRKGPFEFNKHGVCKNPEVIFRWAESSLAWARLEIEVCQDENSIWSYGLHTFNGGGSSSDAYWSEWREDPSLVYPVDYREKITQERIYGVIACFNPNISESYFWTREGAIEAAIERATEYVEKKSHDGGGGTRPYCISGPQWTKCKKAFREWKANRVQLSLF